jgi:hypothetical protein
MLVTGLPRVPALIVFVCQARRPAQMRDSMWVDPDIMLALAPWMEKLGVSPPPSSA